MLCGSELELLASDPSLLYSLVAPIGQGVGKLHKDVLRGRRAWRCRDGREGKGGGGGASVGGEGSVNDETMSMIYL